MKAFYLSTWLLNGLAYEELKGLSFINCNLEKGVKLAFFELCQIKDFKDFYNCFGVPIALLTFSALDVLSLIHKLRIEQ